MRAAAPQLNQRDLELNRNIGRWLILTWTGDLFLPPKGVPFGTHLATFIVCGPGEEINGLNVCWLVRSESGAFYKACDPGVGIESLWFLRYETLVKFSWFQLPLAEI